MSILYGPKNKVVLRTGIDSVLEMSKNHFDSVAMRHLTDSYYLNTPTMLSIPIILDSKGKPVQEKKP